MKVLAVLQNAWAHEARPSWRYDSWVRALKRSRSGVRLRRLFGDAFEGIVFGNTTPLVGAGPDSVLPPDVGHVRALIGRTKPSVVVALGLQAEGVLKEEWQGPLLCLPHPASRVLTNALLEAARCRLFGAGVPAGRVAFRQRKGDFIVEELCTVS